MCGFDGDATLPAAPGGRGVATRRQQCRCTSSNATTPSSSIRTSSIGTGIALVNDAVGIRWLYSFLSADRKKTYCLYEAPNPEALIEAATRLGIPADVIVPVERIEAVPTG